MQDDYIWELLKFLEFRLIWLLYNYISLQDNLYEDGNYNSLIWSTINVYSLNNGSNTYGITRVFQR